MTQFLLIHVLILYLDRLVVSQAKSVPVTSVRSFL
jgi:hypothetical protein